MINKTYKNNESLEAAQINRFLRTFGNSPLDSKKPLFRLVWSSTELETRFGEFDVHLGPIFLRTEICTKEVFKYQDIWDRYILEQWQPPEIAYTKEVPASQFGLYTPLYPFEDKDHNRLPLNMRVVELIMYAMLAPRKTYLERLSRIKEEMKKKEEDIDQYIMDSVESSDITSNLHFGEGIIVPSNYDVQSPNLRKSS